MKITAIDRIWIANIKRKYNAFNSQQKELFRAMMGGRDIFSDKELEGNRKERADFKAFKVAVDEAVAMVRESRDIQADLRLFGRNTEPIESKGRSSLGEMGIDNWLDD